MNPSSPSRVLSFAEASAVVRAQADEIYRSLRLSAQTVDLLDALGRVLAEAVRADRDQPPFARATRDGFACTAASVSGDLPVRVIGLLRAGETWPGEPLMPSQAVEIMTGAPVPAGADCVVMIEHVLQQQDALRLQPGRGIVTGENIVPKGAEARSGDVVLERGTRLSAAQLGTAASCGAARPAVFPRPRVTIVATGDELVEVEEQPQTQQIRNSNSYSLAAQVTAAGGEAVRLPIARDERGALKNILHRAFEADLVLLSGGVSMGKYDLVEEVLLSLGAEFFFTGALIQPGKPVVFGRVDGKYFFGLPGNPVSTMVTFLLFVDPLLGALGGEPVRGPRFVQALLPEALSVKPGLTRFLPAVLRSEVSVVTVRPVAWQGSGDLAAAGRSNCFVVVPPDRTSLTAGETVTVLLA